MRKIKTGFVPLPTPLLSGPAFMVLNIHEHRTLCRIMLEQGRHAGWDNGRLPVTYKDLVEYGVHPRHIAASLRVLEALGLIVCTERGRGANREFRHPSLFRLTFVRTFVRPGDGGNSAGKSHSHWVDPTDEWKKIETFETAHAIAAKHRPHDMRERRAPQPKPPAEQSASTVN